MSLSHEESEALRKLTERARFIVKSTPAGSPSVAEKKAFDRKGLLICLERPMKVTYLDRRTKKKALEGSEVEMRCRDFPQDVMDCMVGGVAKKKQAGETVTSCAKVKLAMACANDLSSTLASALADVPLEDSKRCLAELRETGEANVKWLQTPSPLPRETPRERKEKLREDFFVDEPIHRMGSDERRKVLAEHEL